MRVTYYKRKTGKKSTVWYYRIVEDDGDKNVRSTGKSTGKTSLKEAKSYVLRRGAVFDGHELIFDRAR